VLKYDDVLNRQREAIYSDRRHILEGDNLQDRAQKFLEDVIEAIVNDHAAAGSGDDWDFDALWAELKTLYPISITIDEVVAEAGNKGRINRDFVLREVLSDAKLAYQRREETLGEPAMRELERRVVLSVIDRRWRDHLYEMDYLKDGIGLRAMAQRDPLVEYQREGFALFQSMMGQIREETVGFLFNLEVEVNAAPTAVGAPTVEAKGLAQPTAPAEKLSFSAPSDSGGVEVRNQRGQIEQAATARAQQAEEKATPPVASAFARGAGSGSGGGASASSGSSSSGSGSSSSSSSKGSGSGSSSSGGGQKSSSGGQKSSGPSAANRAQRRAQGKKK
jgi:preprotein translocase subunit SecA